MYARSVSRHAKVRRAVVDDHPDGEVDVAEGEGLRAAFLVGGFQVFSGAEEPVEGDDDKVDDVRVESAEDSVRGVEGFQEGTDESKVGWTGTMGEIVLISECLDERRE